MNKKFKRQVIQKFTLLAMIISCSSMGLIAQDSNNKPEKSTESDAKIIINKVKHMFHDAVDTIAPVCKKMGSNAVGAIKQTPEALSNGIEEIGAQVLNFKDSNGTIVSSCKEIGSHAVGAIKQTSEVLGNGIDEIGIQVLNFKDAVSNKIDVIYSKYEDRKTPQDSNAILKLTNAQKVTGVGLFVGVVATFIAYKYCYGSDIDLTEEIDKN